MRLFAFLRDRFLRPRSGGDGLSEVLFARGRALNVRPEIAEPLTGNEPPIIIEADHPSDIPPRDYRGPRGESVEQFGPIA